MSAATMALELFPEYGRFLAEALTAVVRSEEQNEACLTRVTELLRREGELTVAEREFMKQHGLKQKDMNDVFGTPSIASEVLNGKRELNEEQIRRLSERFRVSPALFS